jgi:Lrp/AsnC family transcriptional regulator, leucine-responsive regulatory protein
MDAIDIRALRALQTDGRETWAALGETLGMTGPAAADRVHRLEERGVIRGYTAVVDPQAVGVGLAAFIAVSLERPKDRASFLALVANLPEIQECHHVAGEDDYLLKIRCRDTSDLERLLTHELKGLTGVARTRTTVVLSTVKETLVVALPAGAGAPRPR